MLDFFILDGMLYNLFLENLTMYLLTDYFTGLQHILNPEKIHTQTVKSQLL